MQPYVLKIKELIEKKRLTRIELAQYIGKTKNTVTNYFTGKTIIDADTLIKIADVLEVPVSYFFEENATIANKGPAQTNDECKQKLAEYKELVSALKFVIDENNKSLQRQDSQIEMLTKQINILEQNSSATTAVSMFMEENEQLKARLKELGEEV